MKAVTFVRIVITKIFLQNDISGLFVMPVQTQKVETHYSE